MSEITLYDWAPSPFCMKVRGVLAYKGVAYERVSALANVREIQRRGGIGKAPALAIDGELIVDSTDIAHEIERRFPSPPLLPSDPRARALDHMLEDWADEALYFYGLYYHWHEPAGRRQAGRYFARTLLGRALFWPYVLRIERQLHGQGTGRKSEAHVRRDLERTLDAVEALLEGRDFLLEDGPHLSDFALAAQLVYLTRAPATKSILAARDRTRRFVERMKDLGVAMTEPAAAAA